jgi:hypothetical protein
MRCFAHCALLYMQAWVYVCAELREAVVAFRGTEQVSVSRHCASLPCMPCAVVVAALGSVAVQQHPAQTHFGHKVMASEAHARSRKGWHVQHEAACSGRIPASKGMGRWAAHGMQSTCSLLNQQTGCYRLPCGTRKHAPLLLCGTGQVEGPCV